jgi:hypothetical protein
VAVDYGGDGHRGEARSRRAEGWFAVDVQDDGFVAGCDPVRHRLDRLVGVFARDVAGRSSAKYLNAPETLVFKKREFLYHPATSVVVCEGPCTRSRSPARRSEELEAAREINRPRKPDRAWTRFTS